MFFLLAIALLNAVNIGVALMLLTQMRREIKASGINDSVPLLAEIVEILRGQSKLVALSEDIHAQLHANGGSSLKDAVDRLEEAEKQKQVVTESLRIQLVEDQLKAEQGRNQLQQLLITLNRLLIKIDHTTAATDRIETAAAGVANDLAASQKRADSVTPGSDPGKAADAASRSKSEE